MSKNPVGRPTVMTDEVIRKLEEAFLADASDREACFFAGISTTAFYVWQEENPDFKERKKELKDNLRLRSKINLRREIESGSEDSSKWWLERRSKAEFSTKTESDVNVTGVTIVDDVPDEEDNA